MTLEKVFVNGGKIIGKTRVGGILGTNGQPSKKDTVNDVYLFTDVYGGIRGSNKADGIGAIVGCVPNGQFTIENAFVCGTVNSKVRDYVGIIGYTSNRTVMKNILNYSKYVISSNSMFNYASGNNLAKTDNILIWEGSSVNVTTEELRTKEFYTDRLKLSINNWSFNGLPQYMPKLIYNGGIIPNQPD